MQLERDRDLPRGSPQRKLLKNRANLPPFTSATVRGSGVWWRARYDPWARVSSTFSSRFETRKGFIQPDDQGLRRATAVTDCRQRPKRAYPPEPQHQLLMCRSDRNSSVEDRNWRRTTLGRRISLRCKLGDFRFHVLGAPKVMQSKRQNCLQDVNFRQLGDHDHQGNKAFRALRLSD